MEGDGRGQGSLSLGIALWTLMLGNMLDAMLTVVSVGGGLAQELNPTWASLVGSSPALFIVLKASWVGGLCVPLIAAARRGFAITTPGVWSAAIAYLCLNAYHVTMLALVS